MTLHNVLDHSHHFHHMLLIIFFLELRVEVLDDVSIEKVQIHVSKDVIKEEVFSYYKEKAKVRIY